MSLADARLNRGRRDVMAACIGRPDLIPGLKAGAPCERPWWPTVWVH